MNPYQFLSEIYRLLGELNDESLRSLDEISISRDVAPIVRAFVRAKQRPPQMAKGSHVPTKGAPVSIKENASLGIEPSIPSPGGSRSESESAKLLKPLLVQSPAGRTNKQIVDLLRRSGLEAEYRPKESRAALMRKITRAIQTLPLEKRQRIEQNLTKYALTGETEGWMKVIRSLKN
jgi:hypothetical protein